jgi:hypothetical protein
MEGLAAPSSPRAIARVGGALYLIIIVFGLFGELFVRGKLIVWGDPKATAERILASESLWRFNIAAELFYLLCAVALAVIFYVLLRPVGKHLALLAVCFNLAAISIQAAGALHLTSALSLFRGAESLAAFESSQLQTLGYLALQAHGRMFSISLLFFGCVCLALGHLIDRSGYFPKWLGIFMAIAGLGYLLDGFSLILSPSFHSLIFPASLVPAFVGETSFCLYLLAKGPNLQKWNARRSTQSSPTVAAPSP